MFANQVFAYDMLMDDFSLQNDSFLMKQKEYEYSDRKDTRNFSDVTDNKTSNTVNASQNEKELVAPQQTTDIEVYSENLQYYPDKNEFEATGDAHIYIPQDKATMWADRLVFNRDTNIVKGYGNVIIKKLDSTATGDFVQINLNDSNALLENPVMEEYNIKIVAKDSNFYPGKLVAQKGQITADENMQFNIGATTFGDYYEPSMSTIKKTSFMKEKYNNDYTIKAKVIEVNSLKDKDELILKGADIYLKKIKIASAPKLRFLTDKSQQYVEANTPEISTLKQFGFFFGPGYVFNLPKSATLKVAPVVLTSSGQWGIGGIARLRTATNVTEAAYGTVKKDWIVRGKQMLGENLWLEYSYNGYMDEWFFGDRIPGRLVQLVYDKSYRYSDYNMTYRHRFSGGYATDGHSSWGTGRYRYQGQLSQNVYSRINKEHRTALHLGYTLEGAATIYGNGETQALFRGGPYVRTELKNWVSHIGYNMGAVHGDSPFYFDKYMYGKQNLYIIEMLRVCKYLSIAYSASLALLRLLN